MYQALYRKYRPKTFSDVAGQEHVTVTLRRQIISGRHSHAYLFVGTRGTGKTTCAKVLSRAINCLCPEDGDPCNKCASCIGIENGSILDVLELDAASNNGVDDVRALREEAIYSPATVSKRVYIIDEVHMLSNSAFNALLKILEEPPEHLVFILATTALHKVPATILSRCQRFSFKRLSLAAITARLDIVAESEGFTLTEDAAKELASLADGSMRDALSLLDQCASETTVDLQRVIDMVGLVGHHEILSILNAVAGTDAATALDILDKVYSDGRDMSSLLSELAALVRDVLVYKLSSDSPLLSGGFRVADLSALSGSISHERLFSYLEVLREAVSNLSRGDNAKLTVEMSLMRMCDERLANDAAALLARIERLENAMGADKGSGVRGQETREQGAQVRSQETMAQGAQDSGQETIDDVTLVSGYEITQHSDIHTEDSESRIANSQLAGDEGFWQGILNLLKNDMSIYSLLSDDAKVWAELQENILTIRAADMFTVNLIESKKFLEPLMDAARKEIGNSTVIRVNIGESNTDDGRKRKIDDLGKFDIVKFE